MQSDNFSATPRWIVHTERQTSSVVKKRLMPSIVVVVICGIWIFARFGDITEAVTLLRSTSVSGTISTPMSFIATPGVNFDRINVRAGPGIQYPIIEKIARGEPLTGIGRTRDSTGAFWIELDNRRGYVSESVLSPASRVAP